MEQSYKGKGPTGLRVWWHIAVKTKKVLSSQDVTSGKRKTRMMRSLVRLSTI